MGIRRFKKYAIGAAGMLALVVAVVLATGSGSAVAAQISSVFVTNDAAHPVPVHEQGTASVNVANSPLPVAAQNATKSFAEGLQALPGGHQEFAIDPTNASEVVISGATGGGVVTFGHGSVTLGVALDPDLHEPVVVPLPQPLLVTRVDLDCGSEFCGAEISGLGT
jgi:hypothetical protein